jgi:bidirectional [NiFe] hydrogenase diaphorase subunit
MSEAGVSPSPPSTHDARLEQVDAAARRQRYRPDALLEVLRVAQQTYGYLPLDVLWHVARQLKLPPSRVYGVATFYHLFTLSPRGAHTCVVCLGTACHIQGGPRIVQALERGTGVPAGQTSTDGRLSLGTSRCLGACGVAPTVIYDGQIAARQTAETAMHRVQSWRSRGSS